MKANHLVFNEATEALKSRGYFYKNILPDGFDHLSFVQDFGKLVMQYHGDAIGKVVVKDGYDNIYCAQNTKELYPHTECYEFERCPPKYLALWCNHPSERNGGQTLLASFEKFYDQQLTPSEKNYLQRVAVDFFSTPGLQKEMATKITIRFPIVQLLRGGERVFRFSKRCMAYEHDHILSDIVERYEDFFYKNCIAIDWGENALLMWDNHKLAHARTSFCDRKRELTRVWIS